MITDTDIKNYYNLTIEHTLLEKYKTFQPGFFADNLDFLYHKPISIDEITKNIFKDFIFLKNHTRKLRNKIGSTKWQLAPYFPENSTFPDPIGAHITVVSRNENVDLNELHLQLINSYIKVPKDQQTIQNIALDKVEPPNWKAVKKIYKLTLYCLAFSEARKSCNLPEKIENKFDFHLTFAVKLHKRTPTLTPENDNFEGIKNAFNRYLIEIFEESNSEEEISEDSTSDEVSKEESSEEITSEISADDEVSEETSNDEIWDDMLSDDEIFAQYWSQNFKSRHVKKKLRQDF